MSKRPHTYVGDTDRKGKGLFAGRRLARATVVGSFNGKPKWIWDIPEEVWPHTIQVDYDLYVVPKRDGGVWHINHSCEPNCHIAGMRIVASRDIAKDEELTFDYSSDVDWPGFFMKCRCGSPTCRKVVRAYRFLPDGLKLRYGRRVAPFIQREYLEAPRAGGSRPVSPAGRRAAPRWP